MSGRAVAAGLTTTIAANLPLFLTGGLAVQMQDELHFGEAGLGAAVGVFFLTGAVCSAVCGRLVERVGPERSLRWSAAISAAVQLTIVGVAYSWGTLMVLLAVAGLANAWAQPASNVFLVRVIPSDRLGLALGLQKSAIPAAALLGGLAVPALALTVGWRWAFVAGAVFSAVSILQVPRDPRPVHELRKRIREGKPDVPTRLLVVLAIGVGFGSAGSGALSAFLVTSGVDVGLSPGVAGIMLTAGSVAGIAVRLLVGARADRYPGRALKAMAAMFAVASASYVLLATTSPALHIIATPIAFATAYAWPGLFHLAVVRSNPSAPGAATGLTMTGTLTGAVSGPLVFGAIAGAGYYPAAWLTCGAFLVAAAVIVGFVSGKIREPSVPAEAAAQTAVDVDVAVAAAWED